MSPLQKANSHRKDAKITKDLRGRKPVFLCVLCGFAVKKALFPAESWLKGESTMRTNIVIDDSLMAEAMAVTGLGTKREIVETALRTLIRINRQMDVLALAGTIDWVGDLDAIRQGRFIHEEGEGYSVADDPSVSSGADNETPGGD
jgi:Arc/MetJ family transcription regulator